MSTGSMTGIYFNQIIPAVFINGTRKTRAKKALAIANNWK